MNAADDFRTGRPVPLSSAGPCGAWQMGVGPGAVVVHGMDTVGTASPAASPQPLREDALRPPESARALAEALMHGSGARSHRSGPERAAAAAGRSPDDFDVLVRGAGPLARRLRRSLGGSAPDGAVAPAPQVLVHQHVVPPEVGLAAAQAGRGVLPVVVQPRRVVIGPVTTVGPGPCLHCLDLHRRDRDPRWPLVATHLGHPVEQVRPVPVPEALQAAAEGLSVLLVHAVCTGRPVQPGLSYEVGVQAPHVVMRRWAVHPRCPWHPGIAL